jgi:hypothetical protein
MFPMSRQEALGHYIFGACTSQGVTGCDHPRARTAEPEQSRCLDWQSIADFEKRTGTKIPSQFIGQLKGDIEQLQMIKDFQSKYAESKGSQGFKSLPPQNRAEAAIEYLQQHGHLPKDDLKLQGSCGVGYERCPDEPDCQCSVGCHERGHVEAEVGRTRKTSDTTKMTPARKQVDPHIGQLVDHYAQANGVPVSLARALVMQESRGQSQC